MRILCVCVAGFVLDAILGDPVWLYHPVRLIGKWIEIMEKVLRAICGETDRALHVAGIVLWFAVVIVSTGIPVILLYNQENQQLQELLIKPLLLFSMILCSY